MRTAITRVLHIDAPLIGFSRSPGVVREVSRAGGLGVFASSHYAPDQLDRVLHRLETELDGRPYGIDIVIPAEVVAVGAGSPSNSERRSRWSTNGSWQTCSSVTPYLSALRCPSARRP
jgi:hypothetical protein